MEADIAVKGVERDGNVEAGAARDPFLDVIDGVNEGLHIVQRMVIKGEVPVLGLTTGVREGVARGWDGVGDGVGQCLSPVTRDPQP